MEDSRFFGQPRGLATLFFTELWERFSYYGMRALLILFMTASAATGGLGFDTAKAGVIYGTYTSLVYMLALPGGWIADRFLGQRKATLWGGLLIMSGHVSLAVPALNTFYLGLTLIVLGTGLLKPNISTMVGQLYTPEDTRRDAGFSIFYMGINLGAFVAPLVTGWLAQSDQFKGVLAGFGISPEASWHWGFGAAALGMGFGLTQYVAGWRHLGEAGLHPVPPKNAAEHAALRKRLVLGIGTTAAVVVALALLAAAGIITAEQIAQGFGYLLLAVVVLFFAWLFTSGDWTPAEKKRLYVIGVLFLAATVFWAVYEQAGSTLNLFAERSTRNELFGHGFPASWWQSVPALFVIILAPVFAAIWVRLGSRDLSSPTKFTIGLFAVAASFGVMMLAARLASGGQQVGLSWLFVTYLLQVIGELCLSPVGLSAMTRLAPARIAGLTMGVWFLASSAGNYLGGQAASLYESLSLPTLFAAAALSALAATALLALMVKPIKRMLASP